MKFLNPIKGLIGLVLFFSTHSISALVAPYYQSIREIQKILDSSEVANILGAYPIQSIIRSDINNEIFYSVTVKDCTLKVKIIYQKSDNKRIGAADFDIQPDPVCHKVTH